MKNFLILYDSVNGQTQKIAHAIEEKLKFEGHWVTLNTPRDFTGSLKKFDGIIVGGPVRMQRYPKDLRKWVSIHVKDLRHKKTAFFSVCLGILQKENIKVQQEERQIAENFLRLHNWKPDLVDIFAGALSYTQYGWLTKMVMRFIALRAGGSIDTHRDHEYTDWNQVRLFVEKFLHVINKNDVLEDNHANTLTHDLSLED